MCRPVGTLTLRAAVGNLCTSRAHVRSVLITHRTFGGDKLVQIAVLAGHLAGEGDHGFIAAEDFFFGIDRYHIQVCTYFHQGPYDRQ